MTIIKFFFESLEKTITLVINWSMFFLWWIFYNEIMQNETIEIWKIVETIFKTFNTPYFHILFVFSFVVYIINYFLEKRF